CPLWANSGLMRCNKEDRYSMTSSALVTSVCGEVRPSVLAALRFSALQRKAPCAGSVGSPLRCHSSSRRRHGNSIGGYDLRLEGEHLAGPIVDQNLHPVHVVDAVLLVVAEGLHPEEVFETPTLSVEKRPVDAEIMGVAVDIRDRSLERDNLI